MAGMFNIAVVFVAAAMYMAFAAPGPQGGQNPLTPPGGGGIPEGANNNYTGPPPNNCTEFVQKCKKLQTSGQVTASASQLGNVPGLGSGKYGCTNLAVSCNGTAPTPQQISQQMSQQMSQTQYRLPEHQTPPATGTFLL